MSGRLIISGKKSYTPWNAKNVERVLRDERAAAERETNEAEKRRQREGELRISTLKRLRSNDDDCHLNIREEKTPTELKHVNLFEDEEAAQRHFSSKKDTKAGIMPVFLVSKSDNSRSMDEFYKRKSNTRLDIDERIKEKNDPMRDFTKNVHHDYSELKRAIKKSKQAPSLEEKVTRRDKKSSSLSKLRRRQMERDTLHSKREEALRNTFK